MGKEGSEVVRIGILGAASIAHKNVAGIAKADGVEVVAVGSRTKSKAEKFLQETGCSATASAFGSYEEVLASHDVDAVYVPLPTALHLEWVQKAAKAKKHILLEKPIALSKAETDGIVKACEEAGVQLMDGTMFVHNPRYTEHVWSAIRDTCKFGGLKFVHNPRMHHIKPAVFQQQQLGKLRSITSTFTWKADANFLENDVRTRKDGDALGCYGDIGWYCIKAALWAFNFEVPVSVQAHPGVVFNKNKVAMHGGGSIVWADGRRLTFDCGFDAVHSMFLQIAGEDGMIEIQDFCIPYKPEVSAYVQKGPGVWHDHDTWIEQKIEEHKVPLAKPQESFMWEKFGECVRGIRGGQRPEHSWFSQAALCNKLCIAVEQSAQEGGKLIDLKSWLEGAEL